MIDSFVKKLDYNIPQELQPYIVAVIQGESKSVITTTYPVHPNGFPLLINIYRDIPLLHINNQIIKPDSRLNVAGQVYNTDIQIKIDGEFGQIGFILYPSAPYYLFHKNGDYFLNQWRSFNKVSPNNTQNLYKNLTKCKLPINRVSFMLEFLKDLSANSLPKIEWLEEALIHIYQLNGIIAQETLAEKLGISLRHFRRKFKEVIGVSPKYFCKVIQLNTVFEMLNSSDTEKLHHLALDCGYYDQAHFINDFKKLIGDSPRSFLTGEHSYVRTYLGRSGI
ncbi:AraC-type DNA-binding protein [Flaviramulus basaltis]|uniref:AraC-type DNA-binding protein n=1 Tax=Flaviramulus basaltis TaxID=369401 RepID=A0A1K2IM84_9FLAO|nr:helix-turn-helix domain-containing protein [Flaviramulus basaltis]SFZ93414.1 AraC-type DNA-binding protein [Flaviramulus basaltis]